MARPTLAIPLKIIKCPFCSRHYKTVKNVNIHISSSHGYKIKLGYPEKPSRSLTINS